MHDRPKADAKTKRLEVYRSYRDLFSSAPIRLMSRTASTMRGLGYDDLATAIGDMDFRTVPAEDPEDPSLRQDWGALLEDSFAHIGGWLRQLSVHPMGYNLDSVGYSPVTRGWSEMWKFQLGIDFENRAQETPQIYVFHGGNQCLHAALLGVAEARRERGESGPATMLVPLPTFSCPMDQMALSGMNVRFLAPSRPDMDPDAADLARVGDDVEIDGVYMMPVNNPTGRTLSAEKLKAFIDTVLERWPHAAVILDSVYVRLHPRHRELLSWFGEDPRYDGAVIFIDSLSKTHGVTGLRAGALLTRSPQLAAGINRYAQNIMAGPSNAMQAVMLSLLAPFVTGDAELAEQRIRLQLRIGRHLQRRRRLILRQAFVHHRQLLDHYQPMLPDPTGFDWEGSMYADLRLSDRCVAMAAERDVPPTVAFYLETGFAGVPLEGFCSNPNLVRHGLVGEADEPELVAFQQEARRYVRLSFGMTPPPREWE